MSDDQTRAVDEALERAQRPLEEYEQWAVGQDAGMLRRAFVLSREHAATLAGEVERLRAEMQGMCRIEFVDAVPMPYDLPDTTPPASAPGDGPDGRR